MTIKDLAALSGYSLGTVSRVLNNQPHVSEKAREQIMAIVKEQGFELNTNARNLKQTHSNNILVIVRGTHNELFAALVERLQTVATGGEYQLVVDYIGELDNEVRRAVKRVREVKPQGILFLGGRTGGNMLGRRTGDQVDLLILVTVGTFAAFDDLDAVDLVLLVLLLNQTHSQLLLVGKHSPQ